MRGSRSSGSERKRKEKREDDEVEQMLKAAQDEILLNLSINSHIARASPSNNPDPDPCLDQDLERRFEALKTKSKDQLKQEQEEHDISARFAALKAKSSSSHPPVDPTATKALIDYYEEESEEDEEAQVQKLIEWAKDAARLDPSPPSPSPSQSDDDDEDDDHHRKSFK